MLSCLICPGIGTLSLMPNIHIRVSYSFEQPTANIGGADGRPYQLQSSSRSDGYHSTRCVHLPHSILGVSHPKLTFLTLHSITMWHVPPIVRVHHLCSQPMCSDLVFLASIREFCPLSMPVYMHDKDGNYVVKTLEEVSFPSSLIERRVKLM